MPPTPTPLALTYSDFTLLAGLVPNGLFVSIAVAFLGFVPMLIDERRRGLHDFVAETVVLNRTSA